MKAPGRRATFEEADLALERTLDELEANFPNYNEWLRSLVAPIAVGRVLEVGAGVGTFTTALLQTAAHVVAVEPSARGIESLEELAAEEPRITVVHGLSGDAAPFGDFDAAVMLNVLEHIEHDRDVLVELRGLVRPGGHVAVFSPAFNLLMSDFDRSIGHMRRYRRSDLSERFTTAGYEVTEAKYVNVVGFFAWLIVVRLINRRPSGLRLGRFYDRFIVPATRWVESHISPPFGQSVLVIGRVPLV
jgi:SAM-dependent methyltransferase